MLDERCETRDFSKVLLLLVVPRYLFYNQTFALFTPPFESRKVFLIISLSNQLTFRICVASETEFQVTTTNLAVLEESI